MKNPLKLKISGKTFEEKEAGKESPKTAEIFKFEKRPGGILLIIDSKGNRTRAAYVQKGLKMSVSLSGNLFHGEWVLPSHTSGTAAGSAGSKDDFIAQFPGKIRKILTKDGQSVQAGDVLLLVEAMKMEFSIKAPTNGKVKKILMKEAQQITPGDLFLEFEETQ